MPEHRRILRERLSLLCNIIGVLIAVYTLWKSFDTEKQTRDRCDRQEHRLKKLEVSHERIRTEKAERTD